MAAMALLFSGLLYFVYAGYLQLLRVLCFLRPDHNPARATAPAELGEVAVLITVHNEATQIVERVENILSQEYPVGLLDIVVASDGSTDDLAAVVGEHFGDAVRLVHVDHRVGKSIIQNQAMETIRAPIVLLTDADTRFAPDFLQAVVKPFADRSVGAVQAHLLFVPVGSTTRTGQSRYWRSELEIRRSEAELGILAVASGSCIALRRDLWRPLDADHGEDCVIPLDVVLQARKVAYASAAIASEPADDDLESLIRTRARMTVRNWQGTFSRGRLLNPFRHPGYAFALWSHKVLRWLSPLWLVGLTVCALALPLLSTQPLAYGLAGAVSALYLAALAGALATARSRTVPILSEAHGFMLANLGFLYGLLLAARGRTISHYR